MVGLFRLARRLLDYGKWVGSRVRTRPQRSLPEIILHHSLDLTVESALSRPLEASECVFRYARTLQDQSRKQAVKKWEQSLVNVHLRPNPCFGGSHGSGWTPTYPNSGP